jgi:hypothetical protein
MGGPLYLVAARHPAIGRKLQPLSHVVQKDIIVAAYYGRYVGRALAQRLPQAKTKTLPIHPWRAVVPTAAFFGHTGFGVHGELGHHILAGIFLSGIESPYLTKNKLLKNLTNKKMLILLTKFQLSCRM